MPRRKLRQDESDFGRAFGRLLAEARRRAALTGEELARAADISLDTVRRIESGRVASPGLLCVSKITAALGVSLDAIAADARATADPRQPNGEEAQRS